MATPTPEQLEKINRKALVPLEADNVHTFTAKIIGTNLIPKYMMRMSPSLLQKFANEAQEGVALLVDHPWTKWSSKPIIPYGRTYDSRLVQEGVETSLYADHYMVKGHEVDGITTDQLAGGIDSGTIFDTSAGFLTTKHTCGICGNNYYSSACEHFRGREYDGKTCYVVAEEGSLMENSLVFDGGYDGAGIVRNRLSSPGSQTENTKTIEYEPLALDAKSLSDDRVYYFFSKKGGLSAYVPKCEKQNEEAKQLAEGDEKMPDTNKEQAQQLEQAQSALSKANGLLGQIRSSLGIDSDDGILTKLTALSAQAQDGAAYKTKLVEAACGAGVRALGEAFNVDAMKLSLSGLPVAEIEKVRDTYEAQAQKALGGGGRHTEGDDLNLPDDPTKNALNKGEKTPEEKQTEAREAARNALKKTGHEGIMKKEAN